MAKVTSFSFLFDYCPNLEKAVEEIGAYDEREEGSSQRRELMKNLANLERRFKRLSPARKKLIGEAATLLDRLFFVENKLPDILWARIDGAFNMAQVLLKRSAPRGVVLLKDLTNLFLLVVKVKDLYSN